MKMITRLILLTTAVLIFSGGCKDDPTQSTFKLEVKANFDGGDFELLQDYENFSGYVISVEELKFYLSNIELIREDGSVKNLEEVALLNFKTGETSLKFELERESFKGINYTIGVPVLLNGTEDSLFNAASYPPASPLSIDNGMYWAWAAGYKFVFFDGRYDLEPADTTNLPLAFSFHTGKDQSRRIFELDNMDIPLDQGDVTFIINWDISKFFNGLDQIDLENENFTHGNYPELAAKLMNNIVAATDYNVQ